MGELVGVFRMREREREGRGERERERETERGRDILVIQTLVFTRLDLSVVVDRVKAFLSHRRRASMLLRCKDLN